MDLDKATMKVLASDTKLNILKSLVARRKMPAELSKELKLAPSTVVEHLQHLEKLALVRRIDTGSKWIYYELTESSRMMIMPATPLRIVLALSVGFIMVIGSFIGLLSGSYSSVVVQAQEMAAKSAGTQAISIATENSGFTIVLALIFVLGIIALVYSIWRITYR